MTYGDAYRVAVELQRDFGREAAHVATARADKCRDSGDLAGLSDWNRVSAVLQHFDLYETDTVH